MIFANRQEAGQKLAKEIANLDLAKPYVFGMARGGVPVAYEVARKLKAPLNVLVVRKLGTPQNPEFAFGAIAPEGFVELSKDTIEEMNISKEQVATIKEIEEEELERRLREYKVDDRDIDFRGRDIILVDDGIATGASSKVAIKYLRSKKPNKIILAAPACSTDTEESLEELVEDIICLESSEYFSSVGQWYEDFSQTEDEEVIKLLEEAKKWN